MDISISYLTPGHNYMACDSDFAVIEKERKNKEEVIILSRWVDLVKNSYLKNPFQIVFVEHSLISSFQTNETPLFKV